MQPRLTASQETTMKHHIKSAYGALWLGVLVLLTGLAMPVQAQAVRNQVALTQPSPAVSNRLDALRARPNGEVPVVILSSSQMDRMPDGRQRVQDAVYSWEVFLLGLKVPYKVISDKELNRLPRETRVMILPATDLLSDRQRRAIRNFMREGGGVIASGLTGYYNERGRIENDSFLFEEFGGEWVAGLPAQPYGILQALGGDHAPADGIPAGFRLNIAAQEPLMAVRSITSNSIGRLHTYNAPDPLSDPFADATLILYGERNQGRFFWTRFNPQDVSREPAQQRVYQTMMINALAYVTYTPTVAVREWPQGMQSAMVMAALPNVGFDAPRFRSSMKLALDALQAGNATGTFFLTSSEAGTYGDLVRRMNTLGEIAIAGDTDNVLINQALPTQAERLSTARGALGRSSTLPVSGLFPPGGFFDANTARAMSSAGLRYLLVPPTDVSGSAGHVSWLADADYREVSMDNFTVAPTTRRRSFSRPAPPATAMSTVPSVGRIFHFPLLTRDDYNIFNTQPDGAMPEGLFRAYAEDFTQMHDLGGLYILPYHPEFLTQTTSRAAVLTQMAGFARDTGSWVTTLRDVYNWQVQKENVRVLMGGFSDLGMSLEIINSSGNVIEGLTLDIRLDSNLAGYLDVQGIEADVNIAPDGRSISILIPVLRTGTTSLGINFDPSLLDGFGTGDADVMLDAPAMTPEPEVIVLDDGTVIEVNGSGN